MPGMTTFPAYALVQTAVYWASPTPDAYGGRTFTAGAEIDVRWEDRQERFLDAAGVELVSRAVVFADQDLEIGACLFLGTLADLTPAEEADPQIVETAYPIRQLEKVPELASTTRFVRKAWL